MENPRHISASAEPRVSVVVPAHNVAPYIREAVESALRQTVQELEVVVVDDGSNDGTVERLQDIRDPRLRLMRQNRRGASAARNAGLTSSAAEYVAFLDGDDYWHPRKLELHLSRMKAEPDLDLTFSLSAIVDEHGEPVAIAGTSTARRFRFQDLLAENHIRNGSAALVRRSALEAVSGFDENMPACNDYDCWLRISLLRDRNVACIPQILTYYRRRSGQISGNWRRLRDSFEQLLIKLAESEAPLTGSIRRQAVCNAYRYLAYVANHSGDRVDSAALLWTSLWASPRSFIADARSWLMGGALLAGRVFGSNIAARMERTALRIRDRRLLRRIARENAAAPSIASSRPPAAARTSISSGERSGQDRLAS